MTHVADREFVVKGAPKFFFPEQNVDRLFAMVMALGAEISAVDEKLDTVVRLLEAQAAVTPAAVTGFEPDEIVRVQREAALKGLVATMLAPFREAAAELAERVETATSASPPEGEARRET
ncbi:hypothetical protein [Sphingomonas bacterium]|uniref:hypothetical protein n=1 Tax=Sphingomonas bacterium TaxID=1895847 RepID=UPI001575AEE8|nr:hypothetical protein [Sphingomonas bacterium]